MKLTDQLLGDAPKDPEWTPEKSPLSKETLDLILAASPISGEGDGTVPPFRTIATEGLVDDLLNRSCPNHPGEFPNEVPMPSALGGTSPRALQSRASSPETDALGATATPIDPTYFNAPPDMPTIAVEGRLVVKVNPDTIRSNRPWPCPFCLVNVEPKSMVTHLKGHDISDEEIAHLVPRRKAEALEKGKCYWITGGPGGGTVYCGKPAKLVKPTDDPMDNSYLCPEHLKALNSMRKAGGLPPAKTEARQYEFEKFLGDEHESDFEEIIGADQQPRPTFDLEGKEWLKTTGWRKTKKEQAMLPFERLLEVELDWGTEYGGSRYRLPDGQIVSMRRKGQKVRFFNVQTGAQVGPELSNVAPAVAYAASKGWWDLNSSPGMNLALWREGKPKGENINTLSSCKECGHAEHYHYEGPCIAFGCNCGQFKESMLPFEKMLAEAGDPNDECGCTHKRSDHRSTTGCNLCDCDAFHGEKANKFDKFEPESKERLPFERILGEAADPNAEGTYFWLADHGGAAWERTYPQLAKIAQGFKPSGALHPSSAAARAVYKNLCTKEGCDHDPFDIGEVGLGGGYRPRFMTDQQMTELINLWHLARTALSGQNASSYARMQWATKEFSKLHPEISSTAAYKDLSAQLGEATPYNPEIGDPEVFKAWKAWRKAASDPKKSEKEITALHDKWWALAQSKKGKQEAFEVLLSEEGTNICKNCTHQEQMHKPGGCFACKTNRLKEVCSNYEPEGPTLKMSAGKVTGEAFEKAMLIAINESDDLKVGDRVKYSDYGLRHERDYMGKWLRGAPQRARAQDAYDKKAAMRGTITALRQPPKGVIAMGSGPFGVDIKWDNGGTSQTATYLVQKESIGEAGVTSGLVSIGTWRPQNDGTYKCLLCGKVYNPTEKGGEFLPADAATYMRNHRDQHYANAKQDSTGRFIFSKAEGFERTVLTALNEAEGTFWARGRCTNCNHFFPAHPDGGACKECDCKKYTSEKNEGEAFNRSMLMATPLPSAKRRDRSNRWTVEDLEDFRWAVGEWKEGKIPTRKDLEAAVWRDTHPDYRGKTDGAKYVLHNEPGTGTCQQSRVDPRLGPWDLSGS